VKVGDLVIVNVPHVGKTHWPACTGMIVDKKVFRENNGIDVENRTWWYVLRSDTGMIEKFHDDWLEAGENGSW
jgi:hypothetical protein